MTSPVRHGPRALSALRTVLSAVALASPFIAAHSVAQAAPSFIEFESGHVRPMAQSADGTKLFVVNTPNNTLEIYNITSDGLQSVAHVPVGLEPVAVAVRGNEVWVVNHLSDSVSIVSLDGVPHVTRTLLVGDEPRDIVFAGSPAKAFITTAHRGQQRTDPSIASVPGAGNAQLTTGGVGRADVWVFSPTSLGNALGGVPLRIMTFFADTPRALAVSPDGNTVYVAALKSGNQTTTVDEQLVCDGFGTAKACVIKNVNSPGGLPGSKNNAEGKPAPEVGLIVKYNNASKKWEDPIGRDWTSAVRFTLPDKDVFAVDANNLSEKTAYQHVGTTIYNMVTNPVSGALYVSNSEASNLTRFEGPGTTGGSTVQGHLAMTRVTVINGSTVSPRHLNKHLDYSKLVSDPGFDTSAKQHSLAIPMEMAVTKDGRTLYVTAFGSSKIGVFNTSDIENDTFNPRTASSNYITVSGGGPSGVVLDEARGRMYVTTRFDNSVKVIDLASRSEIKQVAMNNPEPAAVVQGRPFLYDAQRSSANGEASCASCHIFGDEDALAWDLGNPDDVVITTPLSGKFVDSLTFPIAKILYAVKGKINGNDKPNQLHPMKGPMTTQTLRGMRNSGAMHWRGDRSVGLYGTSATDSNISFINFGGAFEGLLGNPAPMSKSDMQKFADFQLSVQLPPNPNRALDNSLTAAQQRGLDYYKGARPADGIKLFNTPTLQTSQNCNGCHELDASKGFYGANGNMSFEGLTQTVKIPHLRNLYQRVGMYGTASIPFLAKADSGNTGDQIRGFSFTHDGAIDNLFNFFTAKVFRNMGGSGFALGEAGNNQRRDLVELMMAFDSDLAPIVGQQITLTSSNASAVGARIDLLIARAKAPFVSKELGGNVTECDLVASVVEGGVVRGYLLDTSSGSFVASNGSRRSDSELRGLANTAGQEVTYTCTPPGSGRRIAFNS